MVSVNNSFVVQLYRVEAFPRRDRPPDPQKILATVRRAVELSRETPGRGEGQAA